MLAEAFPRTNVTEDPFFKQVARELLKAMLVDVRARGLDVAPPAGADDNRSELLAWYANKDNWSWCLDEAQR